MAAPLPSPAPCPSACHFPPFSQFANASIVPFSAVFPFPAKENANTGVLERQKMPD
jgi:hypothetical protein